MNAYSVYLDDVYITAIGEVPADTVRMIAQSVEPIDSALTGGTQSPERNPQDGAQ